MRRGWPPLLVILLAIVVPAGMLWCSMPSWRANAGLAPMPFVWPRLLFSELLLSLPLGFVIAWRIQRLAPTWKSPQIVVLAALGAAFFTFLVAPLIPPSGSFVISLFVRSLFALLLVTPWCCLTRVEDTWGVIRPIHIAAGMVIWLVLPGFDAYRVMRDRASEFRDAAHSQRLAKADRVLISLIELGSSPIFGKQPLTQTQEQLRAEIQRIEKDLAMPLAQDADDSKYLARAISFICLDRFDKAIAELAPLEAKQPQASLLLAGIYRDLANWKESDAAYNRAIQAATNNQQASQASDIYYLATEGLATNASLFGDHVRACEVLEKAIQGAPPLVQARFHFGLFGLKRSQGQFQAALNHLAAAEKLDPRSYRVAAAGGRRQMETATSSCLSARRSKPLLLSP